MPIGFVAQSQAQIDAAQLRLTEAQAALSAAQAALRNLRKAPPSPEREIQIVGQLAYITTLQDAARVQASALSEVQRDHANTLAGRDRQAANLERALKELTIARRNDPRALLEFESALRDLIGSKAKSVTYAGPLSAVLERCENERREVDHIMNKIEHNRAALDQYDGSIDVLEPEPAAPAAKTAKTTRSKTV